MLLDIGKTIRKLESYTERSFPILSVYLPVSPHLVADFTELVKELHPDLQQKFSLDLEYMKAYLQEKKNTQQYSGIALFSGDNKLWEVITTTFPFPKIIRTNHTPYLEPVLQAVSSYRRYLLVMADHEHAKYITIRFGEIESHDEFFSNLQDDETDRRSDTARDGKIDRHYEEHLHHHLEYFAQRLKEVVNTLPISGVILAGHQELHNKIAEYLPEHLQRKIIGKIVADKETPENLLLQKSNKLIEKATKQDTYQPEFHSHHV